MEIGRPGLALCITFLVAATVSVYGLRDAALLLFCLLAGVVIYKMVSRY